MQSCYVQTSSSKTPLRKDFTNSLNQINHLVKPLKAVWCQELPSITTENASETLLEQSTGLKTTKLTLPYFTINPYTCFASQQTPPIVGLYQL